MNMGNDIRCFAVRRLNPFVGVLQVIETPESRATTSNGVVWHVELQALHEAAWGSLNAAPGQREWYLHGLWAEKEGLVEAPVGSVRNSADARRCCEKLISIIRHSQDRLPFNLIDTRELWLLDAKEGQPLALLDALRKGERYPQPEPRRWVGCFGREGVAGQRRFPRILELDKMIRDHAGFNVRRLWVNWDENHQTVRDDQGQSLDPAKFPTVGLRNQWSDPESRQLVNDYLAWIAPSLLTLPWLESEQRKALERYLQIQATSVEYHWRLYPEVTDTALVRAARVQARLQEETSQAATQSADDRLEFGPP